MTQTATPPDPFEDLRARVERLEEGAASYHFAQRINDRLEELDARLAIVERATPRTHPTPTRGRIGPPITASTTAGVFRSRDEASAAEEEAVQRAAEALRGRSSDPLTARLDAMADKLDEILRHLGGFPFT